MSSSYVMCCSGMSLVMSTIIWPGASLCSSISNSGNTNTARKKSRREQASLSIEKDGRGSFLKRAPGKVHCFVRREGRAEASETHSLQGVRRPATSGGCTQAASRILPPTFSQEYEPHLHNMFH